MKLLKNHQLDFKVGGVKSGCEKQCFIQILEIIMLVFVALLPLISRAAHSQRLEETFQAEIFYDKDELNAGLYEGTVRGRRLFTSSAIPHGQGTIYYFNNDKYHRVNYTGAWVDGTRDGNGTTHFKDGSFYKGEYFDGVEEGEGAIFYPDGNVLEGEFSNGKIHGNAVFKYPNGDQREGNFFENVLDGQVIYTKSNGMIIIETWKNGEAIPDKEIIVQQGSDDDKSSSSSTVKTVDLSDLRKNLRMNSSPLFFKASTGSRQPKLEEETMDVQKLRRITDQTNRDFLLSVFNRVNG